MTWKSPPILDDASEHHADGAAARTSSSTMARRLRLVSWSTPRAVYWVSNTLSETLDQQADARYRAVADPLRRQVSAPQSAGGPPRLAWGMYKRFVLAGVIITCLCAATVASAVLLEVDDGRSRSSSATRRRSIPQVKELLADVAPGKPQTILVIGDDRRKAEALQKHPPPTRSDTMILVRLDPHQARHGADVAAARPRRRHPRPRAPRSSTRPSPTARTGSTLRTVRNLLKHPDPPLRAGHLLGLPRRGRPARLRLRRRRPPLLQRQPPAQRRRRAATRRSTSSAGYQRLCGAGRAGLRALPPPRQRPRPRRAPAVLPRRGQEPDRRRQRVRRPQGAAEDLRRSHAHRHRLATRAILALLKLVAESASKPIQEVQFPAEDAGDGSGNVVIGRQRSQRTVDELPGREARRRARAAVGASRTTDQAQQEQARGASRSRSPGLIRNRDARREHRRAAAGQARAPAGLLPDADVARPAATAVDDSRAYDIVDRAGKRHRAYRIVAYEGRIGQYYGVQGTDWRSPPILDNPSEHRDACGGRTLRALLRRQPPAARRLAHARAASYWVSNTLLRSADQQADARASPAR